MNDTRDFDRAVARWLDAGSDATPPEVIDAVLLAVRSTPQERDFRTLRMTSPLTMYVQFAAVLAIVAVAGVTALYALGVRPDLGIGPAGDPISPPAGGMWPQTSLEEVNEAQELADAGDPRYTWQIDPALVGDAAPWGAEILDRFLREALGWEEFNKVGGYAYEEGGGLYAELVFIRCTPGRTNPLYPDDPQGRGCAPTIDDFRYETVMLTVEQPARRDSSGIWVVTDWEMLQSGEPSSLFDHLYPDFTGRQVEQVAPPTDAEATALLEAFLGARVEGEGAEQYLVREPIASPFEDEEVPLLYATTGDALYERYEIDRLQGPEWPSGWIEFRIRLFAEDETVVEQSFAVVRQEDERLGLIYGFPQTDVLPATENGQAVPVPYSILGGEVSFTAAPPWSSTIHDPTYAILGRIEGGSESQFTMFTVVADPLTGVRPCGEAGPAPADAEALVRSIRSIPDLEATDPAAVSVGGIDALLMDVVAQGTPELGECWPGLGPDQRMHVYLLDLPEGMSARILAISITAHESVFERVVEAAAPVLESFEFHAP